MNSIKKVLKKLSVSFSIITLFTSTISSIGVNAEIYRVDSFTGYPQEKTNWCWVASAETSGKYLVSGSRSQTTAVIEVKGTSVNEGGTVSETAQAANYFTYNRYNYVGYNYAYSIAMLKGQMMSDRMPILGAGYYDDAGNRDGGHATVVYMITYNDDGTKGIGYYDPWDGGRNYICSFDAFCDGSFNNRIYDHTTYTNT